MPLTALDTVAALVAIDLQKGIVSVPTAHPVAHVIGRTAQLAQAFRKRGLPVVLVNVAGRAPGRTEAAASSAAFSGNATELVPQLEPQREDLLITKQRFGAFIGSALHDELQKRGATQIFLTGVSTRIGVESTARSAFDHGYNVVFVLDAMTDRDAEAHRLSIEKIFPRIGECCRTEDVLKYLERVPAKKNS
jgi:nicotinamidase-related amidase